MRQSINKLVMLNGGIQSHKNIGGPIANRISANNHMIIRNRISEAEEQESSFTITEIQDIVNIILVNEE